MGTRNRAAVVVAVIAAVAGVAYSLGARDPGAAPVVREADRNTPLARKGDYLVPRVKPPPELAARWLPLVSDVKTDGGLPNEGLPLIEGPWPPPPEPQSSPAIGSTRAQATPHHQTTMHQNRDVCAAQGMRREDLYKGNRWHSWRCVR